MRHTANTQTQSDEAQSASQAAFSSPQVLSVLHAAAARLKRLRQERGLRLADLSVISGISEAHLSRIEAAERWPSLPALVTLAGVYGVQPSVLLESQTVRSSVTRHGASAVWDGSREGSGLMTGEGIQLRYSEASRLTSTSERLEVGGLCLGSPEELIGMAFAGCFSMALADALARAGTPPLRIETAAQVALEASAEGLAISGIHLVCDADAPVDESRFQELAQITKGTCVVSRALAAVPVTLEARLGTSGVPVSTNVKE